MTNLADQRPPAACGARPRGMTLRGLLVLGLSLAFLAACMGGAPPAGGSTPVPGTPNGATPDLGTAHAVLTAQNGSAAVPVTPTGGGPGAGMPAPTIAATAILTTAPSPLPPTIAEDQAVIIDTLIAHDLVAQSQEGTPGTIPPPYIGINPRAGRGALLDTDSSTETIPVDLIDNLADLGTTVTFAAFIDAVGALENGGHVRDAGIYLTLGNVEPQGSADRVAVYASYYRATNDATGYRYALEHVADGPWTIKDRQQVWDH